MHMVLSDGKFTKVFELSELVFVKLQFQEWYVHGDPYTFELVWEIEDI